MTQPVNASNGRVYGAEAGLNQPFSFLPAPFDGFGVQANYTYISGKHGRQARVVAFPASGVQAGGQGDGLSRMSAQA